MLKDKINYREAKQIKADYFNCLTAPEIARKYGYTTHTIRKYLDSRATKIYIDSKGNERRRCSLCRQYKLTEGNYTSTSEKYYMAHCRICDRQKKRNQFQMMKNKGEERKKLRTSREVWYKHKWRYNIRRKILKIIKYLDCNGKIIRNI